MAISNLDRARAFKAQYEAEQAERKKRQRLVAEAQSYHRMNGLFLVLTIVLVCYGMVMLFSASMSAAYAEQGNPLYYVKRQAGFTLFGLGVIGLLTHIPSRRLKKPLFAAIAYGLGTFVLLLVMIKGTVGTYGATRWLTVAGITIQPSEFCKLAAIYVLSVYFDTVKDVQKKGGLKRATERQTTINEAFWMILVPAGLMVLWIGMIVIQPHLSGAIILTAIVGSMFLVAKIPLRVWIAGLAIVLPILLALTLAAFLLWPIAFHQPFGEFVQDRFAHASSRLTTFNSPELASSDEIYQVTQSRFALGSGGLTGKGLGMGRQKSGFLPMVYNDYILPEIGEELGFFGTLAVVALFTGYFVVGLQIVLNSDSLYSALLSWGCLFMITLQAYLNVGVAAEVIPSTGISLPFFSYGGSSNLIFLAASGFILQISRYGQRVERELIEMLSGSEDLYRDKTPPRVTFRINSDEKSGLKSSGTSRRPSNKPLRDQIQVRSSDSKSRRRSVKNRKKTSRGTHF